MKKVILISLSILAISLNTFSQDNESGKESKKIHDNNEIRLNVATPIFGLPELNYERFITDNMGVGLTVAFSLENAEDMTLRSMFLPYYRIYFGEKKASGFFIEGNMAVVGEHDKYYFDYHNYTLDETGEINYATGYTPMVYSKAVTSFGCGAAFGFKFLTRNGVTGELCLGAGRLFGNTIIDAYPRIGVCIGKRF